MAVKKKPGPCAERKSGRLITISGPPGSGTTTVVAELEKLTGLPSANMGTLFRSMAKERGLSIEEFADLVRERPEIDEEIDRKQIEIASRGGVILEGRLAGFMTRRAGIEGFRVFVGCDAAERAARVARREKQAIEDAERDMLRRERAERERYIRLYGYDLEDMSIYHVVIDSRNLLPMPIARMIAEGAGCLRKAAGS